MCTVRKHCVFWVKGAFQQNNSPGHPLVITKSVVHNMFYKTCVDDLTSFNLSLEFSTKSFFPFFFGPVAGSKMCFIEGLGPGIL